MSPRYSGSDERGRPIVAELGRAETSAELADRRAASSSAHRANQTLLNLLLAIGASLVLVAVLVLVVVRPGPSGDAHRVDYRAAAAQAQRGVSTPLAAPELPSGWYANRAELSQPGGGQVSSWGVGLISPASHYIGLTQGIQADDTWVVDQVQKLQPTRTQDYGGLHWTVYDHRSTISDTSEDVSYAMVATTGDSTVVLAGTRATPTEYATLATAIGKELS